MNMSPLASSTVADGARIVWRMRLSSAARTAVACAAVGVATLYGPKFISSHIKFPAFSYLTAVLIVSDDATLGDTLRGCWHAFCAAAQVVPLAVLCRRIVDPTARMPNPAAAGAVAVASFLVALPECTHLTAKKIAFGQIVLICSDAVVDDVSGDGFIHPFASTALGAFASVFALLLPFPALACHKVQELCRVYAQNASQRMNLYLRASTNIDNTTKMGIITQAKPLTETGAKLLQSIRILEDGLRWERLWRRISPVERLQSMELQMRGIEYSLVSSAVVPIQQPIHPDHLSTLSTRIHVRIEQVRCYSPFHSEIESETREIMGDPSSPLDPKFPKLNQGWLFLYFSCIYMFLNHTVTVCGFAAPTKVQADTKPRIITRFKHWIQKLTSYERLGYASKCSISLGLAMLLGLTFDKENGRWAGLTVAISFVTGRQAIFTLANSRVQGTALGSVYGVICCFLFHYEELKVLALIPWIVFASILRYSKMYGQSGGVSAAIGALLILGRKNYEAPNEFAIARLTQVFIGLLAFIAVEFFLQPIRAATLARNHMYLTIHALQDCIKGTSLSPTQEYQTNTQILDLKEKQKNLRYMIYQLKDYVENAELEPDFWYFPFRTSCYEKLVGSMSNILDMLYFITHNYEILSKLSETDNGSRYREQLNNELQLFQETLGSSYILTEHANTTESPAVIEEELEEAGKLYNQEKPCYMIPGHKEAEWAAQEEDDENDRNLKEQVFQCLCAMGFCINSMMREMKNTEICLREIDQW